jgi:hypothetical protein
MGGVEDGGTDSAWRNHGPCGPGVRQSDATDPTRNQEHRGFQGLSGCWALLVLGSMLVLGGVPAEADLVTQYVQALYWGISTLTTVGYGDVRARTNAQAPFIVGLPH